MTAVEGIALFLLASIVTAIESLVRYAGFRGRVRWGRRTWLHVIVNGVAAVGLLALLRSLGLEVNPDSQAMTRTAQVIAAGFATLAMLRSASFAGKIEAGRELPEELAGVRGVVESARHLLSFLVNRADQEMRERFNSYLTQQAEPLVTGWEYAEHGTHIGAMCQELAGIEGRDGALFASRLEKIEKMDLPDNGKAILLIRTCILFTDEQTTKTAVETIVEDP